MREVQTRAGKRGRHNPAQLWIRLEQRLGSVWLSVNGLNRPYSAAEHVGVVGDVDLVRRQVPAPCVCEGRAEVAVLGLAPKSNRPRSDVVRLEKMGERPGRERCA